MKKLLTIAVLLLCILCTNAQIKFEPGYIVTATGTKTECLVKNNDWRGTPENFEYKLSETSETLKATTDNTTEVSVSGQTFKRFTVNMDRSSDELGSISTGSEPVISRETVFLKLLVKGDANLYKYYDGVSLRYFYTLNDTEEPIALIYKMYKGDDNKILYNKTYKSTLQKLMGSRVNDPQLYKNLNYKDKDMTALFRKYNGITEEVGVDANSTKSIFHLKAGVEARSVSVNGYFAPGSAAPFDFKTKVVPAFGGELEWILPVNRNKWGVLLAVYYHNYKDTGAKSYGTGASGVENLWEAKYSALEVALGGRYYMYLNDKAKFYLNGGYVLSKGLGDSGLNFKKVMGGSVSLDVTATSTQSVGAFGGVGFAYNRLSLEARYHGKYAIDGKYATWSSEYSGVGLLAQYSIF